MNNGSKTLTGSTTDITGETQNQANLYIGSKGGTSNFFTGSISQIMIFNKGLNENEINALHASNDNKPHVGNIFYNNGLVTITKPTYQFILDPSRSLGTNHDFNLSYQGTHLIYENKYQCLAEQHEFKNTLNISARKVKSKNSQELANFTTGSNFSPFVTTIGLYNDNGELLVVGKLGQPIRMLDKIDTTFVVKFDN